MSFGLKGGSQILVCETSYDEICRAIVSELQLRKYIFLEGCGKFTKVWAGSRSAGDKFYREFLIRRGLYYY